jgi:hypothetical protein
MFLRNVGRLSTEDSTLRNYRCENLNSLIVNNEMERMWMETVVAYSRYLAKGTEKDHGSV